MSKENNRGRDMVLEYFEEAIEIFKTYQEAGEKIEGFDKDEWYQIKMDSLLDCAMMDFDLE